ncbi:MAG: hypothetical protein PT118_03850 [Aphanizomenon gracile PMC644.10]|nr:hypothetical protein [Aphanizomenon gracile PMC638.10]MDM3852594.1 hypothetical protein [Aphanizomenon gracile PMC627.10]MDM3858979.1 hypothetical protein [Aphanizomenon gracile PMC644.10]
MTIRQVDLGLKIEKFTTLRYSLVCVNYNYSRSQKSGVRSQEKNPLVART